MTTTKSSTLVTSRRHTVRRALRISTAEGILAAGVSACAGGGALIAWAIQLRASPALVASLAALPAVAQALHLPAARLTARLGARRTALAAAIASRQPLLALIALPWLPLGQGARLAALVALAGLAAALGAVSQHAWTEWTIALFRAPVRARLLARRAGRVSLFGSAAALAVGLLLDRLPAGARPVALAALAGVAWLAGMASAAVLARQPAPRVARRPRAGRLEVRSALAERRVRRGLRYVLAWNAAMGGIASVSALLMLRQLRLGFLPIALQGLLVAAVAAASGPLWARLVDRAGVERVLVLSAAAAALLPLLWLAASRQVHWPITVEAVLGGLLLGGHGVAASHLPAAVAPEGRRAEVLAAFSSAGGLAFAAGSVTSGLLAAKLPLAVFLGDLRLALPQLVLAGGGAVRLGAAALAARTFRGG